MNQQDRESPGGGPKKRKRIDDRTSTHINDIIVPTTGNELKFEIQKLFGIVVPDRVGYNSNLLSS